MSKIFHFLPWAVLFIACLGIALLQLHNAWIYPLNRGFDATAHIDFVEYVKEYRRLPLPREGWEMHQAPLYYLIVSLLPLNASLHFFGVVVWGILALIVWFFCHNLNQEFDTISRQVTVALWAFCLSMPVVIYLAPAVSNEFLATTIITACLYYYCVVFLKSSVTTTRFFHQSAVVLGVLLGLALLSKTTSLVVLIAILLERMIALKLDLKKIAQQLLVPFVIASLIGGWFYARNIYLYGNPIFQTADYVTLREYDQPIVPRTLSFLLSPRGFFTKDLFVAQHTSFLAGTYYSWFYDGHGVMLPFQPYTKMGTLLLLLSVPVLILVLLGLVVGGSTIGSQVLKIMTLERKIELNRHAVLYIYTGILCAAYVQYNFRLPFYSTVKAPFISSLVLPFCYFGMKGLQWVHQKLSPRLRKFLATGFVFYVAVYLLLIARHFWIVETWYL